MYLLVSTASEKEGKAIAVIMIAGAPLNAPEENEELTFFSSKYLFDALLQALLLEEDPDPEE